MPLKTLIFWWHHMAGGKFMQIHKKYLFAVLTLSFTAFMPAIAATPETTAIPTTRVATTTYVDKITAVLETKVDLESEQTITGQKTFSASPIVPTPSLPQAL